MKRILFLSLMLTFLMSSLSLEAQSKKTKGNINYFYYQSYALLAKDSRN